MPTIADIAGGIFLAYYWTGVNMLAFHSNSSPIYRPGYVHGSKGQRALSAALWPRITWMNYEFGFFFSSFVGESIFNIFFINYIHEAFESTFIAIAILCAARLIPIISAIFSGMLAMLSMPIWFMSSKIFKAKLPSGM